MSFAKLIIFHPSPFMVEELDRLVSEIAPDLLHENLVVPDLLEKAGHAGITEELRNRVRQIIASIPQHPPAVVLCSCSTYGGCAEEMAPFTLHRIIRIDRPMAELAAANGPRIGVAAALESTLAPTRDLLLAVARQNGQQVHITEITCAAAWDHKRRGDNDAYIREIVRCLNGAAQQLDVLVLAQGSMAPAAEGLRHLGIPVLGSPRLAIERVARICRETA
jgi:hypothetical protein